MKHLGLPNAQLERDQHSLCAVYSESFLERQSIQVGLGILIEDFPEFSTFVLTICPNFMHLVTYAILATDVTNSITQQAIQDRFERLMIGSSISELETSQSVLEQLILMADVGHCSQSYENFLYWNKCFFYECLQSYKIGKGFNPREGWYVGEVNFLEGYILGLVERVGELLPRCNLLAGTKQILKTWKKQGQAYTKNLVDESIEAERSEKEAEGYEAFLAFLAS